MYVIRSHFTDLRGKHKRFGPVDGRSTIWQLHRSELGNLVSRPLEEVCHDQSDGELCGLRASDPVCRQ